MARKKSRGSKKSRAKKARKSKQSASTPPAEATESALSTDESPVTASDAADADSTPTDDAPSPSGEAPADAEPAAGKKSGKKKSPRKKKSSSKAKEPTKDKQGGSDSAKSVDEDEGKASGESAEEKPKKKPAKKKPAKKKPAKKETSRKKPDPEPAEDIDLDEAPPEIIDIDEADIEVIDLDDEEADLDALVAAAVGEEEPVSIDLDEEVDDPEARRRLIEEALAFVAAEESGEAPEPTAQDTLDDADEAAGPPGADTTDIAGDEPGDDEHLAEGDEIDTGPDASSSAERPLIGPEALLALSEIRAEGLATLPGELVLDLGEASTPDERDRLLAAALAHVEMQDAIYRIPLEELRSRRIKSGIAAAIFLIAALIAVNPPGLIVPTPPPALTESDREQGVLVALTLQAQQVEAFRVTNGRLPRSIAEVEGGIPGIRLVRSSNRLYQLIAHTPAGEPVVYDSSAPDAAFERLWRNWVTTSDDDFGGLR